MTLAEVKVGDRFFIKDIPDEIVRAQAMRLGITEGALLSCGDKIPWGPVIIKRRFQEIAIGRNLAARIMIEQG